MKRSKITSSSGNDQGRDKAANRTILIIDAQRLGPENIHVAHLIIDGPVDSPEIHRRLMVHKGIDASTLPKDTMTQTSSIADIYWFIHRQSRDGWTHEVDLRPAAETW